MLRNGCGKNLNVLMRKKRYVLNGIKIQQQKTKKQKQPQKKNELKRIEVKLLVSLTSSGFDRRPHLSVSHKKKRTEEMTNHQGTIVRRANVKSTHTKKKIKEKNKNDNNFECKLNPLFFPIH